MTRASHDAMNAAIRHARLRGTGRQQDSTAEHTPEQLERLAEIRAEWETAGPLRRPGGSADGGGGHDYRPREDMNSLLRRMTGR